jgi:hypothetical protein
METIRVLNLLNNKSSNELQQGLLEEARDTALHAMNYYLLTYAISEEQTPLDRITLQCQAQVSAFILRSIGDRYLDLGIERDDECLVETGKDMLCRSNNVLRLCRTIPCHATSRENQSVLSRS